MQILSENRKKESMYLFIDSEDDLWTLHNVIESGNLVRSLSQRTEEDQTDTKRNKKAGKRRMLLTVKVEKCEFSNFSSRLRVLGTIVEGPQDLGSFHTLNIEPGGKVTITRDWTKETRQQILVAVEESSRPSVAFLSIENDNAVLANQQQFGIKMVAQISGSISGKFYKVKSRGNREFMEEVVEKVQQSVPPNTPLIVIGPGFTKDEFASIAREKLPGLKDNIYLMATASAGMQGIYEAMKVGVAQLYAKDAKVTIETQEVDNFLTEISRDGKVTYGMDHVKNAISNGAVEKLLITDEVFRTRPGKELIELARGSGSGHRIVSTGHEGGKRLSALGGVAAFLRY